MCGIFCLCSSNIHENNSDSLLKIYEVCKAQINRRGPDFQSVKTVSANNHNLIFAASVLWLQGNNAVQQPIETNDSVFVYNGDLFGGTLIPDAQREEQGDTVLLLKALEKAENTSLTLSNVHGPYSFIYLDKRTSKLYFGRDLYGRRSLLIGSDESNLLLTSVACKAIKFRFIELPAIGIFCYDLVSEQLEVLPWKFRHSNFVTKLKELEAFLDKNILIREQVEVIGPNSFIAPTDDDLICLQQLKGAEFQEAFQLLLNNKPWLNKVESLQYLLETAVEKRIATQPKFCHNCIKERNVCNHALTGVLFSGGVDCAVLALLADKFTDKSRPIDLINVAFSIKTPDKETGLETLNELKQLRPARNWNFVEINVTEDELQQERSKHIADLIYPLNTILDDSLGCALWFASRGQNDGYKSPCRAWVLMNYSEVTQNTVQHSSEGAGLHYMTF